MLYGRGTVLPSEALVGTVVGNDLPTPGTAEVFEAADGKPFVTVTIQNHPDSGALLYVRWNSATAATTGLNGWDEVLAAGEIRDSKRGMVISQVALVSDTALVNGTGFVIKGNK